MRGFLSVKTRPNQRNLEMYFGPKVMQLIEFFEIIITWIIQMINEAIIPWVENIASNWDYTGRFAHEEGQSRIKIMVILDNGF